MPENAGAVVGSGVGVDAGVGVGSGPGVAVGAGVGVATALAARLTSSNQKVPGTELCTPSQTRTVPAGATYVLVSFDQVALPEKARSRCGPTSSPSASRLITVRKPPFVVERSQPLTV